MTSIAAESARWEVKILAGPRTTVASLNLRSGLTHLVVPAGHYTAEQLVELTDLLVALRLCAEDVAKGHAAVLLPIPPRAEPEPVAVTEPATCIDCKHVATTSDGYCSGCAELF